MEKSDVLQGYVDIESGKVVLLGEEFSEESDRTEESEEERLEHVFSIEDHWQQYLALPNVYDGEELGIMESFTDELLDASQAAALREALQGQGAVTRFGRQLRKLCLKEVWQVYLKERMRDIARDWCEENDVDYDE